MPLTTVTCWPRLGRQPAQRMPLRTRVCSGARGKGRRRRVAGFAPLEPRKREGRELAASRVGIGLGFEELGEEPWGLGERTREWRLGERET
jgi:hypothetical protein